MDSTGGIGCVAESSDVHDGAGQLKDVAQLNPRLGVTMEMATIAATATAPTASSELVSWWAQPVVPWARARARARPQADRVARRGESWEGVGMPVQVDAAGGDAQVICGGRAAGAARVRASRETP